MVAAVSSTAVSLAASSDSRSGPDCPIGSRSTQQRQEPFKVHPVSSFATTIAAIVAIATIAAIAVEEPIVSKQLGQVG